MSRLSIGEGEFAVQEVDGTLYTSWRIQDRETWSGVKLDFRTHFPHWTGVRYSAQWRAWAIPLHQRQRLATWADAVFEDAAQHWDEDSGEKGGRERRGREESGGAPVSTLDGAYAVLHLLPSAPPELVQAAHRIAIRQAHPDAGGTHHEAVAVNAAIATIRGHQAFERPAEGPRTARHSRSRERAAS